MIRAVTQFVPRRELSSSVCLLKGPNERLKRKMSPEMYSKMVHTGTKKAFYRSKRGKDPFWDRYEINILKYQTYTVVGVASL